MMKCDTSYEELAAYASGDTTPERAKALCGHISRCDVCRKHLESLRQADIVLVALPRFQPSASAVLEAHRAISEATRPVQEPEIMTLGETAEFLRLTPEQLGEILEELPAFEIAGQVRVRRSRLIEWVQQREQLYVRRNMASWADRARAGEIGKGVA